MTLMIDPLTSLAFSIYSGKGIYALLLGSGVSRASEIPTGWEITTDLIRKLASVEGQNCEPDPEKWFRETYKKEPDYSKILENIAITPSERTNVLSSYFEAKPDEQQAGTKTPSSAHKSIARLVSRGYVSVIITTNFDRLIEQALEAEGVSVSVISTADMARGAMPLAHVPCTVIKLHGDYRDIRFKNTSAELREYALEINSLLDRIFDEYGLIVCGWSATWDEALRSALFRCSSRRFSTYWCAKGNLSVEASALISSRQASVIDIESADSVFSSLEQKVEALELFNRPHPLSTVMAVASLKKFITEERHRIDLRELVVNEVERQFKLLSPLPVNFSHVGPKLDQEYLSRLDLYEASLEMLLSLVANGCFYGAPAQAVIWQSAILRITSIATLQGANQAFLALRRYPACILIYAGGLAAVASHNYEVLRVILRDAKTLSPISYEIQDTKLIYSVIPGRVVNGDTLNQFSEKKFKTPVSDRLYKILREPLRPLIPDDREYETIFDRFEYLFTLVYFDLKFEKDKAGPTWAPVGRFTWHGWGLRPASTHISEVLAAESEAEGESWAPIRGKLFADSARFKAVNDMYGVVLARFDRF